MNKPDSLPITVIIPTHDRAGWLGECLASVAAQVRGPAQVLVIDDGSTDQTERVCREAELDIDYHFQAAAGVSAARNQGLRRARMEWVAFLDSDDLWHPEKLARQWDYLTEHPDCHVIQTEEVWLKNQRRLQPKPIHQKPSGWFFERALELCLVSPSAVLMHQSVFARIGVFDESLPACEDYDLWLRLSLHYPVQTLSQALTIKQGGHPDQLSSQWGLDQYRVQALLKLLREQELTSQQRQLVTNNLIRRCMILIQGFEKRGKVKEADSYREILRINQNCAADPQHYQGQ